MFNEYPYTDFHEMNTDWIISKIKNVETAEADTKQYAEDADAAKVAAEDAKDIAVQAKEDAVSAKDDAEHARDSAQAIVHDTQDQISLLQSRVDNIIPDGTQTAGNTELLDIRVGYDSTVYDSAGNAVRGQVSDIHDALGFGFFKGTDYNGDVNDLTPGATRVLSTAQNIPIAKVGFVITLERAASSKVQIYINAPVDINPPSDRCRLFSRFLALGTWSNWVEFADDAEIPAHAWSKNSEYSADLNDAPAGVTRVLGTAANNPAGDLGYVMTIVRAAAAKAQVFVTSNALYFRTQASGTWSAWNSTIRGTAETDRTAGYTFGDSLMAQDGKIYAYVTPQYNVDEIGTMCVGWQTLLHNEFGVTMTDFAQGGQGIAGQKPVIKSQTFTGVDFVIISVGVNDYSNSIALGQLPTSRNATFTDGLFIDDLCDSIEYILNDNPDIKILLFTPCQRDTTWRNSGVPDFSLGATDIYTPNNRGLYLKDYADAINDVGKMYSCVVCDMYAESGLNYITLPEFTFEGVHPTNEGYAFTSRALFEAFKKL